LQSALLIGKISKSLKNLNPSFELLTKVVEFWLVRNARILENICIHAFNVHPSVRQILLATNTLQKACLKSNLIMSQLKSRGLGATLMVPVKVTFPFVGQGEPFSHLILFSLSTKKA